MTRGHQCFCSTCRRQTEPLTSYLWILFWSAQWKTLVCTALICQRLLAAVKHLCQSGPYPQNGLNCLKRICAGGSDGLGNGSNDKDLCWGNLTGNKEWTQWASSPKHPYNHSDIFILTRWLGLLDLLSPSVLLVPPSSSWPHRTWSAQPGWGPGWETAACRSTALPHPLWIWSEQKHLRGADRGGSGWQKTAKQPCTFTLESGTHQICLCSGSDEGLHSWTLPPEASVECWPPTWEWWGSRSRPLQGQHSGNYTHSLLGLYSTHKPDTIPISRSLLGLDPFGPGIISFFSVLKV